MRTRSGVPAARRDRRGAIAVMAALMITSVMLRGAIAIDYGRLQFFRAQLRPAADAAAHSGAVVLSETESVVGVPEAAQAMGVRDKVNGEAPLIQLSDIKIGDWDDDNSTLDTIAPIAGYDAVKVTARYNGTFLIANRLFGTTGGQLKVTSIAWTRGSVVNTECLKPWAIPYSALLGSIGHNPADVGYNLTDDDIKAIAAGTMSAPIKISLGGSNQGNIYWTGGDYAGQDIHMYTPGNFGHLNLDPTLTYRDEINSCAANDITVGGTVLDSQTGVSVGQTRQGVQDLCMANGSYVSVGGLDFDCAVPLKVAIYSTATLQGTNTEYTVKYIGGVVLTGYRQNGWLYAYFTGFETTGNVSSAPGPVKRIILVH